MELVALIFAIAALICGWRAWTNADGRRTLWTVAAVLCAIAAAVRLATA